MTVRYVAVFLILLCGCIVSPSFSPLNHASNEGMVVFPMAGTGDIDPVQPPDSSGSAGAAMEPKKEKKECLFFTAKWCGPCQGFKQNEIPQLEKWGWNYDKKDKNHNIQPIDFDDMANQDLVQKYEISQLPTFVLVIDGKEIRRTVGSMPAMQFVEFYNGKKK